MNILNIEHISKIYGEKVIFDDVSLGIHSGDKIGVIGVNGTGRTDYLWKWNPCILSSTESRISEETKYSGICDGWKRTSGLEDRE